MLRNLLTCAIATLALGAGATSAQALNGTSGEFGDTEGIFQASCQDLRSATGLAGGDLILACDSNSEQCHLVSGTIDEGQPRGFCADSVPDAPQPHRRGALDQPAPPLEEHVVVNATTFGTNIGYRPIVSTDIGNIFSETFETPASTKKTKTPPSPGKKVSVNVFKGSCTSGTCGAGDGSIVVRSDSCTTVRQILAASVTDSFHDLAYWVFVDLDKTGQKGSEVLSVCPGFAWNFLPTSEPVATELTATYQGSKSILQTPGCFKDSTGKWCCYCKAPTTKCWNATQLKYFCDDDSICDGL